MSFQFNWTCGTAGTIAATGAAYPVACHGVFLLKRVPALAVASSSAFPFGAHALRLCPCRSTSGAAAEAAAGKNRLMVLNHIASTESND